jgi:hypothetical protein
LEALDLALAALPESDWADLWGQWNKGKGHQSTMIIAGLDRVARRNHTLANQWLNAWLSGRRTIQGNLDLSGRMWATALPEGVVVKGRTNLACTGVAVLPSGFQVGGDLVLSPVKETLLPKGLRVGGNLTLNAKLSPPPEGLEVGGDLRLRELTLDVLPAGLRVGGHLFLPSWSTARLPEGLVVGKNLDLGGTRLADLPPNLCVGGNLTLKKARLATLPVGLRVGGNLNLRNSRIRSLPEDLDVGEVLDLLGCSAWDGQIPAGVRVGRVISRGTHKEALALAYWRLLYPLGEGDGATIRVTERTRWFDLGRQALAQGAGLAQGEAGLRPLWHHWVRGIKSLDTILAALGQVAEVAPAVANAWFGVAMHASTVVSSFDLRNLGWLTALPDQFTVKGSLDLKGSGVSALGDGLTVGGSLGLEGTPIQTLPSKLAIGGDLFLYECVQWDGCVPEDARVGGRIFTEDHPQGVALASLR